MEENKNDNEFRNALLDDMIRQRHALAQDRANRHMVLAACARALGADEEAVSRWLDPEASLATQTEAARSIAAQIDPRARRRDPRRTT